MSTIKWTDRTFTASSLKYRDILKVGSVFIASATFLFLLTSLNKNKNKGPLISTNLISLSPSFIYISANQKYKDDLPVCVPIKSNNAEAKYNNWMGYWAGL